MKRLLLALASFVLTLGVSGQITFERSYDIYESASSDLVFCQDDGYLMAMLGLKDKYYLSLIKTDLYGDTLWTRDHQNIKNMAELTGTEDEQGNIYISFLREDADVLKLDPDGNILWKRNYSNFKSVMTVDENTLWICADANPGNYLYKIDASTGDSLWRSPIFNDGIIGTNSGVSTSIVVTEAGDVVVTITNTDYLLQYTQSQFFKLPLNGVELEQFTIESEYQYVVMDSKSIGNEIVSIALDATYGTQVRTTNYFIKYLSDGTVTTFIREQFGYAYAQLTNCVVTSDNKVVGMGKASPDPNGIGRQILLHCFSATGDSLWTRLLSNSLVTGHDLKVAKDNGFAITGPLQEGIYDFKPYLIKTNSEGLITSTSKVTETNNLQVYPNPSTDYITFNTSKFKTGTITFFDQSGKACTEAIITGNKTTIDTRHLQPGIYLYKLISGDYTVSGKVVKR